MNKSWIIEDYAAALIRFGDALQTPATTDLIKAGRIRYFEFCFEPAWKAIKTSAEDLGPAPCQSPKACFTAAFSSAGALAV